MPTPPGEPTTAAGGSNLAGGNCFTAAFNVQAYYLGWRKRKALALGRLQRTRLAAKKLQKRGLTYREVTRKYLTLLYAKNLGVRLGKNGFSLFETDAHRLQKKPGWCTAPGSLWGPGASSGGACGYDLTVGKVGRPLNSNLGGTWGDVLVGWEESHKQALWMARQPKKTTD